jgi:hypothetical protein
MKYLITKLDTFLATFVQSYAGTTTNWMNICENIPKNNRTFVKKNYVLNNLNIRKATGNTSRLNILILLKFKPLTVVIAQKFSFT